MNVTTLISVLVIFLALDGADTKPTQTRCLTEDWLVEEYVSLGCKVDTSNPECIQPIKCPEGCLGDDETLYPPGEGAWREGTQECRCMYLTALGEYNPVRLPKGVAPKVRLPNFRKMCQIAGCRNPRTRKVLPVGASFTPKQNQKCECVSGPDRTKLDSIAFYHLECGPTFPVPPMLGNHKVPNQPPKLPTFGGEDLAEWPVAPNMPLHAMLPPKIAGPEMELLPETDEMPSILVPKLPMKIPSKIRVPTLPKKLKVPKLPLAPVMANTKPKSPPLPFKVPPMPRKVLAPPSPQ